jgi:hypothetical protein
LRAILLTLTVLLASCGRKTYHSLEVKQSDSLFVKTEQIKAPLLNDVMIVPEICKDSIATEFKRIYVRDTDTIIVEVKDNQLTLDVRQKERIISELKETILNQHKEISEKRVITKIAWKPILILSGIILLFLLVPTIPQILRKLLQSLF